MKKALLALAIICAALSMSACGDDKESDDILNKVEINGTVYDIMNKGYDIIPLEDGTDRYHFMIMNPKAHISIFILESYLGKKIDMTASTGSAEDWTFICSGVNDDDEAVDAGASSDYTGDISNGSWMKIERADGNFNLSFDIANAKKTVTLKSVVKGGFNEN